MGGKNKNILVFVKEAGKAKFFLKGVQSQGGMNGHGTHIDGRTRTEREKKGKRQGQTRSLKGKCGTGSICPLAFTREEGEREKKGPCLLMHYLSPHLAILIILIFQ